jgi:Spy/CpxP family protein refolding chaperone
MPGGNSTVLFRNIAIAFFAMCLSIPAFAQQAAPSSNAPIPHHELGMMPMWGMASDQAIDRALDTLKRTLNLSASQVTRIRQLAQSRRDTFRSIREQAQPKVDQLMTLLKQTNPDPAAVGRIVVDLKAIHEQAREKQTDLEKQLSSILNPTQQQTVDTLRNQAQTFTALRRIGLLGAPAFPHGFMSRRNAPSAERSDVEN